MSKDIIMKKVVQCLYKDDPYTKEMFEWSNGNIGRSRRIDEYLKKKYGTFYQYKIGLLKISEELYHKYKEAMEHIEKHETLPLRPYVSSAKMKDYQRSSKVYIKAIESITCERTLKRFSDFVGIDFTFESLRDKKYYDLIVEQHPLFTQEKCKGESNLKSSDHILNLLSMWDNCENKIVKKRIFSCIYPIVNHTKYNPSLFAAIKIDTLKCKQVSNNRISTIKNVMKLVDTLIANRDPIIEIANVHSANYKDFYNSLDHDKYENLYKKIGD